jgi:gingipain R
MNRILQTIVLYIFPVILSASTGYHVNINQTKSDAYELTFELGDYKIIEITIEEITYSKIIFDGSITTNRKGFAELPIISAAVQLPPQQNVDIVINTENYKEIILDYPLLPSRGVIYRNQDPSKIPYTIDPRSVTDDWYPEILAKNTHPYIIKDVRGKTVKVYPFQYNAQQNVLRIYENVNIEIVENNSPAINPLTNPAITILREMDGIYRSVFINYNQFRDNLTVGEYGDILVITTDRDTAAIDTFIQWKKEKGFNVSKEIVAVGTNVKNLIKQKYNENNNILYVQLVGDYYDVKSDLRDIGGEVVPVDPALGCIVGSDSIPDICIGRFSANSSSDVSVQVNKVIDYEKNPELGADWYKNATGIGSDDSQVGDDNERDYEHIGVIWNDKLDPFTYNTYNQIIDPNASSSQVSAAVNGGTSLINYTGHGWQSGWGTTNFSNSSVSGLTNGNKLPWIISVACNNGTYHNSECFGEAWLKKSNGGAVLMLASSISQPWNPPMRGQDYMMDVLIGGYDYSFYPGQNGITTTEQRTSAGSIILNGIVLMGTESYATEDIQTIQTWTTFGDPSMQIRTAHPAELLLSNEVVQTGVPFSLNVTAGIPVEDAIVCLSQGDIYNYGITDINGNVLINQNLNPGAAKLVVTGFNTSTVYRDITVIPPEGAYIITNNFTITDTSGNDDGKADFGENILLDIEAMNVGIDSAFNVIAILSTNDKFVTITDSTHEFGEIYPDSTLLRVDAFAFSVADSVPDGHFVLFNITYSDSIIDTTWNSTFSVKLNAPDFKMLEMTVLDTCNTCNDNGILDPGETADIRIKTANMGHSDAPAPIMSELLTASEELTINTSIFQFDSLAAEDVGFAYFNVTVNDSVAPETPATLHYSVVSGSYSVLDSSTLIIGEIPMFLIADKIDTVTNGYFFDSGGPNDNYRNQEHYINTFIPKESGNTITVNFTSFNVELDYDYLRIYDGIDTTAQQVAGSPFTGTNSPGLIVASNSSGAFTFKFTSDIYLNESGWEANISCTDITEIGENNDRTIPITYELFQNYPNPFNPVTTIKFSIPKQSHVKVEIFDITGRKVKVLLDNNKTAGFHNLKFDAGGLASGVYFYKIKTEHFVQSKKLLLLK